MVNLKNKYLNIVFLLKTTRKPEMIKTKYLFIDTRKFLKTSTYLIDMRVIYFERGSSKRGHFRFIEIAKNNLREKMEERRFK